MILRICYANTQRWYDDYIELECQGMPLYERFMGCYD